MKCRILGWLAIAWLTASATMAMAEIVVIGTPPPTGNPGGGAIAPGRLEGQTFTVPSANILQQFTIYYTRGFASQPASVDYGFGIWAWSRNPYGRIGPILFSATGTVQSQGQFGLYPLTFDTSALALDPGGLYVAMLWQTGGNGSLFLPVAGLAYDGGGRAGCISSTGQCGELIDDLFFSATFASPTIAPVPTMSGAAISAMALLLLACGLYFRHRLVQSRS